MCDGYHGDEGRLGVRLGGNAAAFLVLRVDTLDTRAPHTTHTHIGLYPVFFVVIYTIVNDFA